MAVGGNRKEPKIQTNANETPGEISSNEQFRVPEIFKKLSVVNLGCQPGTIYIIYKLIYLSQLHNFKQTLVGTA